jgi:hypothetical protein
VRAYSGHNKIPFLLGFEKSIKKDRGDFKVPLIFLSKQLEAAETRLRRLDRRGRALMLEALTPRFSIQYMLRSHPF